MGNPGLRSYLSTLQLLEEQNNNHLVRDIPDAREGFRMIFSKTKYPGYGQSLSWRGTEDEGNWYQMDEEPLLSGWLCPALSLYFPLPPEKLYVSAEPLTQAG